jgi:DNA-binding response OmpR family regulator
MATRIAVCNHSEEILNRFQQFLESHGFTVAIFLQELTTLPRLNEFKPDMIILGYTRGYPSNYPEFIQELRANPETDALPILVCITGRLDVADQDGYKKVEYMPIEEDALNLEHVLVAIRVALNLNNEAN